MLTRLIGTSTRMHADMLHADNGSIHADNGSIHADKESVRADKESVHGMAGCALACMQTSRELEELSTFLNEAVNVGTEGLIVKTLDSTYEPSKRSAHWLKLKKDYLEGVGDTFDLVPIGAWYGK